jgi:isoaspartyl peptidase/L-asparaginase-like protein (Ntn-hydrolase superfamily)
LVYDILKRVQYKNESIQIAAQTACDLMLERHRGSGGVIAIDKNGNVGIGFSSSHMAWAYQKANKVYYGVDKNQQFEMDVE